MFHLQGMSLGAANLKVDSVTGNAIAIATQELLMCIASLHVIYMNELEDILDDSITASRSCSPLQQQGLQNRAFVEHVEDPAFELL